MIKMFMFSLITMLSIVFIQMIHPLAIAIVLLFQTLFSIILMGSLSSSFWFSYVTFLIFIGGVLILFTYITSISSNEMFTLSSKLLITMLISSLIMFMFLYFKYSNLFFILNKSYDKINFYSITELTNNFSLLKIFFNPTASMTIFLVLYLFLALMIISKIINTSQGPLRQNLN